LEGGSEKTTTIAFGIALEEYGIIESCRVISVHRKFEAIASQGRVCAVNADLEINLGNEVVEADLTSRVEVV